jgi:hypothetical protein
MSILNFCKFNKEYLQGKKYIGNMNYELVSYNFNLFNTIYYYQ